MSDALIVQSGSIKQYIAYVNSIPLLTPEEELELSERQFRHSDLKAASKLVLSHLRVVVAIARNYAGYGLSQADLIQEGNIGLMKAVKRFDPSKGVRLFSFAIHWIKAEIQEYILKNWRLVRIATTKAQRKLFFNLKSMRSSLSTISDKEARDIAEALGVKAEEVKEMELRMSAPEMPIDKDEDSEESSFAAIDWLSKDSDTPEYILDQAHYNELQTNGIQKGLESLDERSRRIIHSRWLDSKPKTLQELSKEYNISAERVRQIESKALESMKKVIQEQYN